MNVNLYVKPSTQNNSATALNSNSTQYEQKTMKHLLLGIKTALKFHKAGV